jgi:Na+-driven multidrug efflux pump
MNYVLLKRIGDVSEVNAFAIINYGASFSSLIFFGASEGMRPLFGQFYGAKNESL